MVDTKEKIHKARLQRSERLQRVLRVLSDGREHTTWEIQQKAYVCAVSTCICELRGNGIPIKCRQVKKGIFAYKIGE